ncbi:flagellin, partial [Aurantimonas sp. Leaf443]|uniref:flagellin n=1 Tax=Aurantimonas sp. Leaf443 TaxID=1736378 RepID=UPI001AEC549F
MVSINSSATLAIRNLQSITKSLAETQGRMTTGFKVRSAKDNASVWQAATTLRSEIKTSSAMSAKLDGVQAAADIAVVGVDTIVDTLGAMKSKLTAYGLESDTDRKAILLVDINALKREIITTISAAEYNGANWLDGSATTISYSATFEADGDEESTSFTLTNLKTSLSTQTTDITDLLTIDTTTEIDAINTAIDVKIKAAKLYSSQISGLSSRITSQQDLLQKIADVKETALGSLVDADLEEEAAKA